MNIPCGICGKEFRANDEELVKCGFDLEEVRKGNQIVAIDKTADVFMQGKVITIHIEISKVDRNYSVCPLCATKAIILTANRYSETSDNATAGILEHFDLRKG